MHEVDLSLGKFDGPVILDAIWSDSFLIHNTYELWGTISTAHTGICCLQASDMLCAFCADFSSLSTVGRLRCTAVFFRWVVPFIDIQHHRPGVVSNSVMGTVRLGVTCCGCNQLVLTGVRHLQPRVAEW